MRKFKIEWEGEEPSLTEEEKILIDRDIDYISECLEKASDLVYHMVMLSNSLDSPTVIIDGKDDVDDTLYLTYYDDPEWVTLDENDSEWVELDESDFY